MTFYFKSVLGLRGKVILPRATQHKILNKELRTLTMAQIGKNKKKASVFLSQSKKGCIYKYIYAVTYILKYVVQRHTFIRL